MYFTKNFNIKRAGFEKSAQAAIQNFFNEHGYLPTKVFVHPDTNVQGVWKVKVMIAGKEKVVPVEIRQTLPGLGEKVASLEIIEPNSAAE